MPKVLIVNTVPTGLNGITKAIKSVVEHIDRANLQIDYVSICNIPSKFEREINDLFNCVYVIERNRHPVKYYNRLKALIKNNKYDVVHAHGNSHTLAIEMRAAKAGGCKLRIAHGQNSSCRHAFIHKVLAGIFAKSYNYGIACSYAAGNFLFGALPHAVIHNGIDIDKYKFSAETRVNVRESLNISEQDLVLGNVARLVPEKNNLFLIDVIERLIKIDSRYRLLLIGDGIERAAIENAIAKKNLSQNVLLLGTVDSLRYLFAFDVYVMPSIFEGLPIALIEAQASGLNCIVSDKISDECNVTDSMKFLPIDDVDVWVQEVLKIDISNRATRARKYADIICNSDFDIFHNAQCFYNIYKGIDI